MDVLPSGNIFRELQVVHDTGYFSSQPSLEDRWQQVCKYSLLMIIFNDESTDNICYFRFFMTPPLGSPSRKTILTAHEVMDMLITSYLSHRSLFIAQYSMLLLISSLYACTCTNNVC